MLGSLRKTPYLCSKINPLEETSAITCFDAALNNGSSESWRTCFRQCRMSRLFGVVLSEYRKQELKNKQI